MKPDSLAQWRPAAATLALAVPVCLAFNVPPSATFLNQAAALVGWPVFLLTVGAAPSSGSALWGSKSLGLALLLLVGSCVSAMGLSGLPPSLGMSAAAMILAAGLVASIAIGASRRGDCAAAFRALCVGLVAGGVLSSIVAIVQVYVPGWADGTWIATPTLPGRASGNVRQPNHLSTLLLSATIAVIWLAEAGVVRRTVSAILSMVFVLGIVLSASRTGMLGVLILGLWGLVSRRLPRGMRWLLVALPVAYVVFWLANAAWAHESHHVFGGEARLTSEGDISSSRFAIWSNTLSLIAQNPLFGVGFGEFNFAWSLTPFPHRPVAFFDHTHNLVLQLLVELGIPLGLLVLGLLGYSLWRAFVAYRRATGDLHVMLGAAFMMVFLMMVHSLLEYPLWYAYFLLPTCFTLGLCLGAESAGKVVPQAPKVNGVPSGPPRSENSASRRRLVWTLASVVLMVGAVASLVDYRRVVVIFSPPEDAAPLSQRIADGERSWFFAHHAYYAAATVTDHPSDAMAAFKVATHYLLDTRLMMAWANALNESGDVERARYIAARLREFRNDDAKPFFAPCDEAPPAGQALPFQCTPPTKSFTFRDFR